jgi:hypothetical protein
MRQLFGHLRGNAIAYLALFVALSGTAYAALGKNSVGSRQIKRGAISTSKLRSNAVIGSKVKGRSLNASDLAAGTIPPRTGTLRSGETITGQLMIEGRASGVNQPFGSFGSFQLTPASAIPETNQHIVTGSTGPNCPGQGQADPGHLCVYQTASTNNGGATLFDETGHTGAVLRGFGLDVLSVGVGQVFYSATWAYREP